MGIKAGGYNQWISVTMTNKMGQGCRPRYQPKRSAAPEYCFDKQDTYHDIVFIISIKLVHPKCPANIRLNLDVLRIKDRCLRSVSTLLLVSSVSNGLITAVFAVNGRIPDGSVMQKDGLSTFIDGLIRTSRKIDVAYLCSKGSLNRRGHSGIRVLFNCGLLLLLGK